MFRWISALILNLPVLVACGSPNNSSLSPQAADGGGDASASYTSFCASYAQVACSSIASCCNMTSDACRCAEESMCQSSGPDFSAAGIEFDSGAAQACLAGMSTVISDCAYVPTSSPEYQATRLACRNVIVGTLPIGSECTTGASCPPAPAGSVVFCGSDSGGGSRCKAAPLLNEGDPCDGIAVHDCAGDLYCDLSNTPFHCAPLKADGATCQHANECISLTCTNSTCVEPSLAAYCQTL
jgi:hypothetical protein